MQSIELITAQLEISGLKARHLRLGDTRDWLNYAAMLTDDFVLDISESGRIPIIRGRDPAVQQIRSSVEGATTVHQAHLGEFEPDGDEVLVTWAMNTRVVRGPDQPSFTLYGYHFDRWVRQGTWKLAALRQTTLHLDVLAPVGAGT
jgi:SnoaL-like domain